MVGLNRGGRVATILTLLLHGGQSGGELEILGAEAIDLVLDGGDASERFAQLVALRFELLRRVERAEELLLERVGLDGRCNRRG